MTRHREGGRYLASTSVTAPELPYVWSKNVTCRGDERSIGRQSFQVEAYKGVYPCGECRMFNVRDVFDKECVDDANDSPLEGGSGVEMPPKANGVLWCIDEVGHVRPLYSISTTSVSIQ